MSFTEEIKSEDVENLLKEVEETLQKFNELIKQFKDIVVLHIK